MKVIGSGGNERDWPLTVADSIGSIHTVASLDSGLTSTQANAILIALVGGFPIRDLRDWERLEEVGEYEGVVYRVTVTTRQGFVRGHVGIV